MKTTYKLPVRLRDQLRIAYTAEYNAKSKSRWIREAIVLLLEEDQSLSSVGIGDDLEANTHLDTVELGDDVPKAIEAAIAILRRQDPLMEGVMASIVRAAIKWRLGKSGTQFQTLRG